MSRLTLETGDLPLRSLSRGSSDKIQPTPLTRRLPAAFRTDTFDDEPVTFRTEAMLGGHLIPNPPYFLVPEFHDRIALGAVHVIMRRITEIVLVNRPVGQPEFTQKAAVDQQT